MSASPWERLDRLRAAPTRNIGERAVLLAATRWADGEGLLYPSLASWAELAGLSVRGLRAALRRLEASGLVVRVSDARGGAMRTVRYRVPLLADNAEAASGLEPGSSMHITRNSDARNPEVESPKPGSSFRRIAKNSQENNHQQTAAAADFFTRFGIEHLRDHPNATPERVLWIEREAPKNEKPAGWAAAAILRGYQPPPPTKAERAETLRAERQARLARFDALPDPEKAAIIARVRERYPNLHGKPEDDPAVRGAIAKIMETAFIETELTV